MGWYVPNLGYPKTPAVGADGIIYVVMNSSDGKLFAIKPDGKPAWPSPFQVAQVQGWGSAAPLIGPDGTIYVGFNNYYFYAVYSSSPGLAQSPWPMYHRDVRHTACVFARVLRPDLLGLIPLLLHE